MHNRFWAQPAHQEMSGEFVILKPHNPERDVPFLYRLSHGTPEKESVWNYLYYGPFQNETEMASWYSQSMTRKSDPLVWSVFSKKTNKPCGITALLAIVPSHGRAEIGHVWLSPEVHRTKINTEAQYLILKYLFNDLKYRRVEWKCDAFNHASRTTAARMGFVFEGRFRQHMFVRGKNRDTDWFAMIDKDWPRTSVNFEKWLYSGENVSLMRLNHG